MTDYRREKAYQTRVSAALQAKEREHPEHQANGDEQRFASANYALSFTKGLVHNRGDDKEKGHGLVENKEDFERFRRAIDEGFIDAFTAEVRPAPPRSIKSKVGKRQWEAPTAGVAYDLQGPDSQAVTMDPAPAMGSEELAYEMAEVYELALLRDVPLVDFSGDSSTNSEVNKTVKRLNDLPYTNGFPGRKRTTGPNGVLNAQTLFRGSSPKVDVGPYLSQFMLIGNDQPGGVKLSDGLVQYGALRIDQRVPIAAEKDWLTDWDDYIDAQNGADLRDNGTLFTNKKPHFRFITTPRDLATYVHDDALYEAYLNACLILLSMGSPFDPGFSNLSGQGKFFLNSLSLDRERLEVQDRAAGGFALYGPPHILTLVTEVATRALKAVRYQKFNNHIRLRPEAPGRPHRSGRGDREGLPAGRASVHRVRQADQTDGREDPGSQQVQISAPADGLPGRLPDAPRLRGRPRHGRRRLRHDPQGLLRHELGLRPS